MTDQKGEIRGEVTDFKVFMRGLVLEAQIGLYPHEQGRTQPLIVDVELTLGPRPVHGIGDTFNYERLAARARAIVAEGHIDLVETFAQRLATACLSPGVRSVRVRVEKPEALPGAAAAGVEVVLTAG